MRGRKSVPAGVAELPRRRIERQVAAAGLPEFARSCARLLDGGEPPADLLGVLAGRSTQWFLTTTDEANDYWVRVWAARGLLWAWHDDALPALLRRLDDDAWRVREMALKVVARHRLDEALPAAVALRADPVPRVRRAATRAVTALASPTRKTSQ